MIHKQPSCTLSIIIVSYNTVTLTLRALDSVVADLKRNDSLYEKSEIILIDNNSRDGSQDQISNYIKSHLSIKVLLIKNKENIGFAKANNQGIGKSQGEFVLLLNSDAIVQLGALTNLISSFAQHPLDGSTARLGSCRGKLDNLGILAALLLNSDNSFQPQGGSLPSLRTLFVQMFFLDDLPLLGKFIPTIQETGQATRIKKLLQHQLNQDIFQIGWVAGTAMMIKREVIDELGLLDENIFMYGEDIEYCMRAKHKHWDIAIDPQAKVVHLGSASSSSEQAIIGEIKSYLYIWAKHKPHWQRKFMKMILFCGIILRICLFSIFCRDSLKVSTYQKALNLLN